MGIQYDSANNQVVFSGDAYVKRTAAGAVQVGNATTGPVFSDHALFTAITAPATPAAGKGRLYTAGASGSEELYWLNSGGSAKSLSAPTPPSGDTKVIYNDGGAWAAADVYYTKGNGYLGVGQATPGERLHLKDGSGNGAVVLGAHQNATAIAGTVEWTGTALRWYDGSVWKSAGIELTDPLLYKGVIDCSTNPNYPAADAGFTYRISVAGKIGGASGPNVEAGDMLVCHVDGSAAGTHAVVGANWDILQINLDGAVIGPTSATDSAVALFDSTTGKLIKNSLVTIDGSGSVNIPSGQSYKINGTALTAANVGAEPTLPLSTRGDLLYRNASNVTARLAVGTNEQVITTNGTDVSWGAVPGRHDAVTLATSATTGGLGLSTQEISFQAASGSTNGYLTSTNWTTFNSKVSGAAGSNTEIQYNSSGAFGADSNLVWDNSNKRLGVGTTPSYRLHVVSATGSAAWVTNADTAVSIGTAASGLSLQNSDSTTDNFTNISFRDAVSATGGIYMQNVDQTNHYGKFHVVMRGADGWLSRVIVTNDGKVGIGTSSPDTRLEVSGGLVNIAYSGADGAFNEIFRSQIAGNVGVSNWRNSIWSSVSSTPSASKLKFALCSSQTTQVDVMTLCGNGRVGIGNTAPSYILHTSVDGRGDVQFDSHSASDDGTFLWLRRSGGTQASPAAVPSGHRLGNIAFAGYYDASNSSWGAVIQSMAYGLWSATNRGACLQFYTTTTGTTALTERMRIIDNGYVGIGATAPDAKLQVNTWAESNVVGNTPTVLVWGNVGMSDTSETVLRLQRPVVNGTSYNGGVDFNIYRYNTSGVSPYTQMNIALKAVASYTQTATVNVISMRDTGNVGIGNVAPDTLLTLGTVGSTAGAIKIAGLTSGTCTVRVAAAAGSGTIFELPATNGTDGYVLKTNGSGVTSWVAASGGSPGGSDTYVQYNNASAFGGMDTFRWSASTFKLILGKVGQAANVQLAGSTSGTVDIAAPATVTSYTLTLPANDGSSGQFLQTNGSGTCTWVAQSYNADTFGISAETTDTTCFPVFVTANTGNLAAKVNAYLLYNASTGLLTLGASGSTKTGMLGLAGATSGLVTVTTAAVAGTWTMTLPATGGTNGYFLQTNGSGTCTWALPSGGAPGGGDTYVQYNNGGAFGGASQLLWDETNKRLTVGNATAVIPTTLHVDRAHGYATLGSELVTNGSFTGGTTGWTLGTNWAYGTDAAVLTNSGSSGTLSQSITLEADTYYYLAWSQKHSIAFNAYIYPTLGSEYGQLATSQNTNTQYMNTTFYSASAGSVALVFNVSDALNTGTITIDDVSLKKITRVSAVATFVQSDTASVLMNDRNCLGFGSGSLQCSMTSYSSNTGFGSLALSRHVAGGNNTAFGAFALSSLSNGSGNIAIGAETLRYLTSNATANIMIGSLSGKYLSSGTSNIVLGQNSIANSKYCNNNIFIGGGIANAATFSGSSNVGVGNIALSSLTTGYDNFAFGGYALYSLTTGYRNTAVGYAAGRYATSGSVANQTSTLSLYLGYSSRSSADGNTNEVVIGANAVGNGSNTSTIGHTDVTKIYLRGDIYSNTAYAKAVGGTNRAAYVDNTGLIGTLSSSLRTKQDVVDMEDVGWIDRLHPVNFCYRSTPGVKQYGLIAEEVEGVNRDIVGYDWEGLPDSVNYDRLVPVLLKAVKDLRGEVQRLRAELLP